MSDIDEKLDYKCYKIPRNKSNYFAVDKDGYLLVQNERVVLVSQVKQLMADELEKMICEIDNPRHIDKGNEAYYDQAESFRLGYNLSIAMLRQKLEEWKK